MNFPFQKEQLDFVVTIAQNRVDFLTPFFRFLNYFDSAYFFFFLIPIAWLGISYQWGIRIFYWATLNNLINSFAKSAFGWPRPIDTLPEIGLFHPHSHGFPSGAAQTCMFLGCLLIYYWRKPIAWVIGITYILLISFSRLYLGVHYPLDILGGWILGFGLFILFVQSRQYLESYLVKKGPLFCFLLSLCIALAIAIFSTKEGIKYIMGSVIGINLGIYISLKNHLFLHDPRSFGEAAFRSILGVVFLFLIIVSYPGVPKSFYASLGIGLFMALFASPLCRWITRLFWAERK